MKTIATYSFLPWLRQGVANIITATDGDTSVKTRASINVTLQLTGQPVGGGASLAQAVSRDIELYGPGDLLRIIVELAILRLEPRNWITNFESNYFAAIDFSDGDFPWRYTPACPDSTGLRLRPWIALVVLAESEFQEGKNASDRPLPYITVPDASVFPPADQLWAWAHVHFNQSLSGSPTELVSPDMTAVLPRLQAIVSQNPDLAYSRILCPRRLADNTGYHAFLMPVFEIGRLAGHGQKPDAAPFATFSAWATYAGRVEPTNYPFYYRWYFRTGSHGDFEYLVNLLKPQPLDPRVGTRDMDVKDPGSNIPGITDPALGGVLLLGGALRVPDADLSATDLATRLEYENWDQPYPHAFETALAKFINLADDYSEQASAAANSAAGISPSITADPDPLITVPLYGRWHSLTQRLLFNSDGTPAPNRTNWVHRLNLDPQFRVAANFGTDVVDKKAEEYMKDAWEQIGDVLAANMRIRRLQVAMQVSSQWHTESLKPLAAANPERALMLTAPVAGRVLVSGSTVAAVAASASSASASPSSAAAAPASTVTTIANTSLLPPAYTSAAMRRVIRPGARLMRSLPFTASITPQNLLARVNSGTVSAAPPKLVPPGVPTVNQTAAAVASKNEPSWIVKLLQQYPWLTMAVLVAAIVLGVLLAVIVPVVGIVLAIAVAAGGVFLFKLLKKWGAANASSQSVSEQGQTPAAVAQLPKSPDFVLTDPGTTVRPATGATDSPTAANFKNALRDSFSLLTATRTVSARPAPIALSITSLVSTMVQAVDPLVTIPKRAMSMISIPSWIVQQIGDQFGEVMAYPKIDLPMYGPLKDISSELLLPNINLIPPNSITLIETNQKFIEAYMVGLNHDFARKLLWREYPTDQRGSYFWQFWDPGTYLNTDTTLTTDQIKEKLYDIPELHRWALNSNLGDHDNRAPAGQTGEQAVLVIRGELLKKYPTAVIYAHHAQWAINAGSIDPSQPRSLEDIDDAFEDNPPPSIIRTPLYEAKVDPDIYFFGFDLTIAQAKGGTGQNPNDDPGWFFVIKQRPGEPRFGLELTRDVPSPEAFVELTWDDVMPGGAVGQFLPSNSLGTVALTRPTETADDKLSQYNDDEQVDAAAISSARWAYILFRSPVMVAVHADQMLGSGS